jgi:glycosyltransferase involved in cell wall biosynthesis
MIPVRVLYVLKRFPRLSETFIINEIRALERTGAVIEIVSLMHPEAGEHQEIARDVAARIDYVPTGAISLLARVASAHAQTALANPFGYVHALGAALRWSLDARKRMSLWKHFARAGYVAAIARGRGHERMHAHFAHGPASVAHFASLMTGIPFSFTAHAKDLYLSRPASIARRAAGATFVATCTRYNVEYLERVVAAEDRAKIQLVYHGIDLDAFARRTERRGAAPELVEILSVGRLVEKKGMDDVLRAFWLLRKSGRRFRATIVGAGPMRAMLENMLDELDLRDSVALAGAMTHARLRQYFERADLFVLAPAIAADGDRDGIPNVLVEAAASGVPIVTTNVSGIPELVQHGKTGLLVEPRSPATLAWAMIDTIVRPGMAARRAAAAADRAAQHFNVWHNSRRLATLFEAPSSLSPLSRAPAAAQEAVR